MDYANMTTLELAYALDAKVRRLEDQHARQAESIRGYQAKEAEDAKRIEVLKGDLAIADRYAKHLEERAQYAEQRWREAEQQAKAAGVRVKGPFELAIEREWAEAIAAARLQEERAMFAAGFELCW